MLKLFKMDSHHQQINKMLKLAFYCFLIFLFFYGSCSYSYESENKLKTVIVGKLAKYITWKKKNSSKFVITVLGNEFGTLFDEVYLHKQIKHKPVEIKYIKSIDELKKSEVLFISKSNRDNLNDILAYTKHKNILTISDKRGFAQKGGIIQLYFLDQMLKIRINVEKLKEEGFGIDRTLLRVVDVLKRDKSL